MRRSVFILLLSLFINSHLFAQQSDDEVRAKIGLLEEQMNAMMAELAKLKNSLPQAKKEEEKPKAAPSPAAEAPPQPAPAKDEKKAAGIELGNGIRAIPYGTIYFNLFANDAGSNNSDIPLFAAPGKGNSGASARQSRFGLRIEGGKIGKAKLSGLIEADFYGGSPAIPIGENFGVIRMRLANARLDWKRASLTIGQDWAPFAPNNPVSIADAAIPQFAAAGNNWARLPQLKLELRAGNGKIAWQGAILAPQSGDSPSGASFLLQTNSGGASRIPYFQSRLSINGKNWLGAKKAGSLGASWHYGRSRAASTSAPFAEESFASYGIALDWNIPLHKRLSLAGEAFSGSNLGGFQGGVFQGHNSDFAERQGNTLIARGIRGIRTSGGWLQLGYTPPMADGRFSIYGSAGIDDPRNADLISFRPRDFRSRNLAFAFDAIYKFSPQFQIGLEIRNLTTDYTITKRKKVNHINLGAAYSF